MVRLADAQPADVRLLHPEEGLPRRRPRLPPQPACKQRAASADGQRTSSTPSTATSCCGCSTRGSASRRRARRRPRRAARQVPYLNGGLFDVHQLEAAHPDDRHPRRGVRAALRLLRRVPVAPRRPAAAERQRDQPGRAGLHLREVHQPEADGGLLHQGGHHRVHRQEHDHPVPVRRRAARSCAIAFEPDGPLWRLLRETPTATSTPPCGRGHRDACHCRPTIAAGLDDVSKRGGWNRPRRRRRSPCRPRPGASTSPAGSAAWRSATKLATARSRRSTT